MHIILKKKIYIYKLWLKNQKFGYANSKYQILVFGREWERTQRLFGKVQLFKYIYRRQIFPPTTHLLENKASRAQLVSTTVTADSADYRCGTWGCFKEFCSKAQNSWQLASPAAGGWAAAVNGGSPRLTGGAVPQRTPVCFLYRQWCTQIFNHRQTAICIFSLFQGKQLKRTWRGLQNGAAIGCDSFLTAQRFPPGISWLRVALSKGLPWDSPAWDHWGQSLAHPAQYMALGYGQMVLWSVEVLVVLTWGGCWWREKAPGFASAQLQHGDWTQLLFKM